MIDTNCNGCKYSKKLKYSAWAYCSCNKCEVEVRAKAEQDFQNSTYWNDYLSKVIADTRADEREHIISVLYRIDSYVAELVEKILKGEYND